MPISIHHLRAGNASRWAVCHDGEWAELDGTLADLLALPLDRVRLVPSRISDRRGDPEHDRFPLTSAAAQGGGANAAAAPGQRES